MCGATKGMCVCVCMCVVCVCVCVCVWLFPFLIASFVSLQAGHACGDDMDMVNGAPIGCIRVSFGYMSTFDDAEKFIDFVKKCLVEKSCLKEAEGIQVVQDGEVLHPVEPHVSVVHAGGEEPHVSVVASGEEPHVGGGKDGELMKEVQDLKRQLAGIADTVKSLASKVAASLSNELNYKSFLIFSIKRRTIYNFR